MRTKDLFNELRALGKLEYGSHIKGTFFRSLCDIPEMRSGSYEDFKKVELEELKFSGYIRDQLLKEGKYFKGNGDDYLILLPSQNKKQTKNMFESAAKKYRRGIQLNNNTPLSEDRIDYQDEIRAKVKLINIAEDKQRLA